MKNKNNFQIAFIQSFNHAVFKITAAPFWAKASGAGAIQIAYASGYTAATAK